MTSRITFLVISLFWGTMTYLLWRSEYVGHNELGSGVPVEVVWQKILTAPDASRMEIMHDGKRVGDCQWMANIGQDQAVGRILDDASPEATAPALPNYRLNLVGNVTLNDFGKRLGFDLEVRLTTNEIWQAFDLRFKLRPTAWEVHSVASEQKVRLVIDDREQGRTEHTFKFADFQNPQALLQDFNVPAPLGMLGMLNPFMHGQATTGAAPALAMPTLDWKARNDWIPIGHTSVRAYRLEATLLERYRMRLIVSGVGEILRMELPDGWELVNDQLLSL